MILGFKKQFVEPIQDGTKIHTIRRDPHCRWYPGRNIQFVTGARTKNYKEFKKDICRGVQKIWIDPETKSVIFSDDDGTFTHLFDYEVNRLAHNDGFESTDAFWAFFPEPFEGVIIHWTDFKY